MNQNAEKVYRQAMSQGHSAAWDMDWEQAAQHYRRALQAKPNDFQALTSLALAFYEMGRLTEAEHLYIEAAKHYPQSPVPWEKLALIYGRRGEIKPAVQAALRAAEAHARQGDIQKAIDNWLKVLRLNPENLTAHSRLALVYEKTRRLNQAVEAYLNVAALLQARGKKNEALQAVQHALQLIPNHPDALQARALLQHDQPLPKPERLPGGTAPLRMARIREMEGEAEESAGEPQPLSQDVITLARKQALTALAELLFATAEETEPGEKGIASRPNIDALLRGGPTNPSARRAHKQRVLLLLGQGIDWQTQGNFEQAAAELSRVHKAGLQHPALHFNLGWLFFTTDQPQKAIPHLKEAVLHPDYALASHLLLGRIYRQQERWQEAAVEYLAALQKADALTLDTPQAREAVEQLYDPLAQTLSQEKDTERLEQFIAGVEELLSAAGWQEKIRQARAQLPTAPNQTTPLPLADLLLHAESSQIVNALARIVELRTAGHLAAAMEEAHLSLLRAPTYLPLHALIGDLLEETGARDRAVAKFTTIARTYAVRGDGERAVEYYRRALQLDPLNPELRLALVETLIAQDRLAEAVEQYIDLAETFYRLADVRRATSTYEEALRLTQRLGAEGPTWRLRLLRRLADLAEQALDWGRALRYYEQIHVLAPEDLAVRWKTIRIHLRLGHSEQALALLDDTIRLAQRLEIPLTEVVERCEQLHRDFPDNPDIGMRMAQVYALAGRQEDAIQTYDSAGEHYLEQGNTAGAIQAIQAILALHPPQAEEYRKALEALQNQRE